MTGFGAAQGQVEGVNYTVEIRSVNNRYLKPVVKLPEIWFHAEAEVEKLLRTRIHRGSVTIRVQMRLPDSKAACRINLDAVASYVHQLKMIEVEAGPTLRIDLGSLLQMPGACTPPPNEEICQSTHDGLMKLVDEALEALVAMRRVEGAALEAELLAQCDVVESCLDVVRTRAPEVIKDYQERLTQRVRELLAGGRADIDAELLAREVAIFAERCDVTEEVARLSGHIEQFRQATTTNEAAGRKLDFVAQEMLREANTIASKANDADIAQAVVEMKTAIDRIKEQVANVE